MGFICLTVSSSLQQYYSKNRILASAIAITGFSVGTFLYPPLTRLICDTHGWRFATLVMAGVVIQAAWAAMFLRPKPSLEEQATVEQTPTPVKNQKCTHFGCHLLGNSSFLLYCSSSALFFVGFSTFMAHIVNKAIINGISRQQAALIPSLMGIASIVGRLLFGLMTAKVRVNKVIMYGLAKSLMGVTVLLMNVFQSFHGLVACSALANLFLCK